MSRRVFSRANLLKLVLFLVAIGLALAAIHVPTLRLVAVLSAIASAVVLCLHFSQMGGSIDPVSAIDVLTKEELDLIKSGKWGPSQQMSDLHSFARIALDRQELPVYKRAIGAAVHLSRCFLERASEARPTERTTMLPGADMFADSVFRRLRSHVSGMTDSPDAILSTIEEVGRRLRFNDTASFDALAVRAADLCETAAQTLPWPEQEHTVADILDIFGESVLAAFGLSGAMRNESESVAVVVLGVSLGDTATRIVADAASRAESRPCSGRAWASLVRFSASGMMAATFHKGKARALLTQSFCKRVIKHLSAPPVGLRQDILYKAHLEVTVQLVVSAGLLPDSEALCPRLPAAPEVAALLGPQTVMLVRAFAASGKPKLMGAALGRIAAGGPGTFELHISQLMDIVQHDSFAKVLQYEQLGGPLGSAILRVAASAHSREDRTASATLIEKLIADHWPVATAGLGLALHRAAESLRLKASTANDTSDDDIVAWFMAGGLWFKDKVHPVANDEEISATRHQTQGQVSTLRECYYPRVKTRVEVNGELTSAVGLFRHTLNIA